LRTPKSYLNPAFMNRASARPLRILAEYLEPRERFARYDIADTIVLFGSARARFSEDGTPPASPEEALMSRYYDNARTLARRLTEWSKGLEDKSRRFVVCSGGGPGIMEAANRGASEAHGVNVGLNIELPFEQHENPYITRELGLEFHYFFMRKFWFVYLAKAIVIFPGGFGTMDEFFEVLTLVQTKKLKRPLPIVLFGKPYWSDVINFDVLVRYGTIDAADLKLFLHTDSVDEAFDYLTAELSKHAIARPGGAL
jgi:uncharacterized protein (TIGR00730 family)